MRKHEKCKQLQIASKVKKVEDKKEYTKLYQAFY